MAELADALDSGSNGRKAVQVQVLLPAPNHDNLNLVPIGDGFGLLFYIGKNDKVVDFVKICLKG